MIYIIMSSIIILAILFLMFGAFTMTEDLNNKTKDEPKPNEGDGDVPNEPVSTDIIEPTPIKPVAKRAARKVVTKGSVQPSAKRVVAPAKKRVTKKVGVKKVAKK